jgi:hypothetical protein
MRVAARIPFLFLTSGQDGSIHTIQKDVPGHRLLNLTRMVNQDFLEGSPYEYMMLHPRCNSFWKSRTSFFSVGTTVIRDCYCKEISTSFSTTPFSTTPFSTTPFSSQPFVTAFEMPKVTKRGNPTRSARLRKRVERLERFEQLVERRLRAKAEKKIGGVS